MLGKNLIALASRRAWGNAAASASNPICFGKNNVNRQIMMALPYTTTTFLSDLSKYYRVEVSNAARSDATKITVVGPDVDGILASMTVALAQQGCSLKELHAGYKDLSETVSYEKQMDGDQIEDIFFVSKHKTGEQFPDAALQDLGESLLKSLTSPMTCLSGKGQDPKDLNKDSEVAKDEQITVLKKNA